MLIFGVEPSSIMIIGLEVILRIDFKREENVSGGL
jgi:hypothetical protein